MTNALVPAANADINAALRALGIIEPESSSGFNRAKLNGTTFELGDDVFPSNQKSKAPAFIGRILEMPDEYIGIYIDETIARTINRPEMENRYCKSHLNKVKYPNEGGEYAEQGYECHKCPINPWLKKGESPLGDGKKCKSRAELLFQRCEADGTTLDPRPWTLDLSPTGVIELKGFRKEPERGHVSELNFMQKLARLGIELYCDDASDTQKVQQAIGKAALALSLGGVIAEFRLVSTKSPDGARNYEVVSLNPIAILEGAQPHSQLPAGAEGAKNVTPSDEDDLPF